MKKNYLLLMAFAMTSFCYGQTVFINEIHYDNAGGDVDEGFEIAGPAGLDLTGWKVIHYNGSGGTIIITKNLSGIFTAQQNGYGTIWFAVSGLQNDDEGLALVNPLGVVIEFLSYEGSITATVGAAAGMNSLDIGVYENATPIGQSMQKTDTGWVTGLTATPNLPNTNQTTLTIVKNQIEGFNIYPNPVLNGKFIITTSSRADKLVKIYSLLGKQVYSKSVKQDEAIQVSNLVAGIYVMKVEEDGKIATRKLVVQ